MARPGGACSALSEISVRDWGIFLVAYWARRTVPGLDFGVNAREFLGSDHVSRLRQPGLSRRVFGVCYAQAHSRPR
jgi:hypothetical protein